MLILTIHEINSDEGHGMLPNSKTLKIVENCENFCFWNKKNAQFMCHKNFKYEFYINLNLLFTIKYEK